MSETEYDYMLTTIDNPYNPFEDFDGWYAYDEQHNYKTLNLFARKAKTTALMSEIETNLVENRAIVALAKENFSGMHRIIRSDGEFVGLDQVPTI